MLHADDLKVIFWLLLVKFEWSRGSLSLQIQVTCFVWFAFNINIFSTVACINQLKFSLGQRLIELVLFNQPQSKKVSVIFWTNIGLLSNLVEVMPIIYALFFIFRTKFGAKHYYQWTFVLPNHLPKFRLDRCRWPLTSYHGLFRKVFYQTIDVVCIHIRFYKLLIILKCMVFILLTWSIIIAALPR